MAAADAQSAFLDANVLFSAALGGDAFKLLVELGARGRVRLLSSDACVVEAERNLALKKPAATSELSSVLQIVRRVPPGTAEDVSWAAGIIDPGDVHVLASARRARADFLVTGDVTHFGGLMNRPDMTPVVMTPRQFLTSRT